MSNPTRRLVLRVRRHQQGDRRYAAQVKGAGIATSQRTPPPRLAIGTVPFSMLEIASTFDRNRHPKTGFVKHDCLVSGRKWDTALVGATKFVLNKRLRPMPARARPDRAQNSCIPPQAGNTGVGWRVGRKWPPQRSITSTSATAAGFKDDITGEGARSALALADQITPSALPLDRDHSSPASSRSRGTGARDNNTADFGRAPPVKLVGFSAPRAWGAYPTTLSHPKD